MQHPKNGENQRVCTFFLLYYYREYLNVAAIARFYYPKLVVEIMILVSFPEHQRILLIRGILANTNPSPVLQKTKGDTAYRLNLIYKYNSYV